MLLIYSPEISTRLEYVLDVIFRLHLDMPYRITSFEEEVKHEEGPKIAYSLEPVEGCLTIPATGLLFERDITDQSARIRKESSWSELPVFFVKEGNFALPFDLFSGVFYLITRYEEHLPFEHDEHHRFQSGESLAFHRNFLDRPLVNEWVIAFSKWLIKNIKGLPSPKTSDYRFIPTIDVDQAWAFEHKGFVRSLGGFLKDLKRTDLRNYRHQVIRGNQYDPFDTFTLIRKFHQEVDAESTWFFLLGNHSEHDKNTSWKNPVFRQLIKTIAGESDTGIHPSYASYNSAQRIRSEILRLEEITSAPVERSRQHYLRMELPQTYRTLCHLGIKKEFSMGYAERPGFRAGMATPYPFFDLEENKSSPMMIYPFQLMDITLQRYLSLEPEQGIELAEKLIRKTREVGGTFITLWHNESLSEWREWSGWSEVYRQILKLASKS